MCMFLCVQVLYEPPQTFKHLVGEWMRSERVADKQQVYLEWQSNIFVGGASRQPQLIMTDPAQLASWRTFHAKHAHLYVLAFVPGSAKPESERRS